ncbi:MAG: hypothetical protein AAF296_06555 [Pseudomonadota bacterium]
MIRTFAFSIAALGLTATASASSANATAFTLKLETPKTEAQQIVADGNLWSCEGDTCTATLNRKKATVRTCQKAAKEIGSFVSFESVNNALSDDQLGKCNSAAK